MNDLHIDDFCKDAALILARLYSVFPRKSTMYVEDISGPDNADEFGLHSDRHMSCLSTMIWLQDEGYIRFEDTVRQEAIDQAVLSHKAFTLLCSPVTPTFPSKPRDPQLQDQPNQTSSPPIPQSLIADSLTNIAHLKKAIQNKDSIQIKSLLLSLLMS